MQSEWADFLRDRKAPIPPYADLTDLPGWLCPTAEIGMLALSGKDASSFLQGQATCDILALAPGQSTLGAFCNAKGRVIALFRVFKSEATIYLLLPQELVAAVYKRLRMYVLRADVKIEEISSEWLTFGVGGENLASALARLGMPAPAEPQGITSQPDCFVIRIPSGRLLFMAGHQKAKSVWAALEEEEDFTPSASSLWRLADIQAGIPLITQATSEEFVPQMLNLDLLGGISFSKGCYTGQEIVARTHYLGNLKRRMYRLQCPNGKPPKAGEPIHVAGQHEQSAGKVLVAAPTPHGSHQVLAVLNITQAENSEFRLHASNGSELSLLSLPYQ